MERRWIPLRVGAVALALAGTFAGPPLAGATAPEVSAYQSSWAHRALGLQYGLAADVPLRDAPWLGTHNSFNSAAEMGVTLSDSDPNQKLGVVDQLDMDIRSIELDLHWSALAQAQGEPQVCHATGPHFGCTIEKPLTPVLAEVVAWLRQPAHRDDVLLLYLEDHLDDATGYAAGAKVVRQQFGDLLYAPPGDGRCHALPLDLTRKAIQAAGKQVIVMTNCGVGGDWPGIGFQNDARREDQPHGFKDFPDCGPDNTRAQYDATFIRYFEDSTSLTAATGGTGERLTPATTAAMFRCGVDLTGFDQLTPADGRLEASVWSWARGEPRGHGCAVQRTTAAPAGSTAPPPSRWYARSCVARRRAACRNADGVWVLSRELVFQKRAEAACRRLGSALSVPRTGYEAQRLRLAMSGLGDAETWLGYRVRRGLWMAADRRG